MLKLSRLSARYRFVLNILVTIASLLLCAFLSLMRLPGMEILGIAPNWLLIWLVSWSLNRSCLDSVVAGLALGAIQDSLTSNYPSHIMVFGLIGFLTSRLHRQRYVKEELIAVVLIVFVMTLIADGAIAFQYYLQGGKNLADLWIDYQRIASLLLCLVVSGLPSSIIPSSNGGDNLAIFKESAFSVISYQ